MNAEAWNLAKTIEELTLEGQDLAELVKAGMELIKEKDGSNG